MLFRADEYTKRGWKVEDTWALGVTLEELDTAKQRTDGASEALAEGGFPKEHISIAAIRGLADVTNAFDAANVVLTQHQKVKHWLVFGMNDESVLGGIRALEGRKLAASDIIGVGIGGTTGRVDFEKPEATGFFSAVLISPKRHGYETTEYLYKWITEDIEPPRETLTTGLLIDRSNYRQIMQEQGVLD